MSSTSPTEAESAALLEAQLHASQLEAELHEQELKQWEAQQAEISSEVSQRPLISTRLDDISVLKEEFKSQPEFLKKIELLSSEYSTFRKVRGDGNCFYRAYLFAIYKTLLSKKHIEQNEKFLKMLSNSVEGLDALGYAKMTTEDFYDIFADEVNKVHNKAEEITEENIIENMNQEDIDNYCVMYSRFLTSLALLENADQYTPFLPPATPSLHEFINSEVQPLNREADFLQITSLTSLCGIPVAIVYLDRSEGQKLQKYIFPEKDGETPVEPVVTLLYRPGHYDVIYPKE